jgi:Amt family ammonium transporter
MANSSIGMLPARGYTGPGGGAILGGSVPAYVFAQVQNLQDAASQEAQTLDSAILSEQFYFWTVVVMWLIHVGFMSYEAGVARRKNVMATAMKNILTIAVVTPTFYYFGWWIYNCNQPGFPPIGPGSSDVSAAACQGGIPWSDTFGPNLTNNINLVFFLAFLLFSWTTASIMSGAIIERARLSAYLLLAALLGSVVWILDAAWGWSSGGWLTLRFGFHDSIASAVVHGVAGSFTLGVLFNLGPRLGKYTREGLARTFRPHNLHLTLMGLMLIFTGFYAFYAACLVIASTTFPGWANIYLSPTTLGSIAMIITMGFAGGFTGAWFASRGDPFWTVSGGLAGVIGVSAGADVYAPTLGYLIAMLTSVLVYQAGRLIEHRFRVDDAVGAVAVHGVAGFLGILWVGIFAAGYPTGLNNVESSLGGQLMGLATFVPLGFLSGWIASYVLKRLNVLRVPLEVELEGLDLAEYEADVHPEHGRVTERIFEPDGRLVDAEPVLIAAALETNGARPPTREPPTRVEP